jgi:hypothetical protein
MLNIWHIVFDIFIFRPTCLLSLTKFLLLLLQRWLQYHLQKCYIIVCVFPILLQSI